MHFNLSAVRSSLRVLPRTVDCRKTLHTRDTRTVKLYKILLGKSPLLGSNDETATSNGPENGGALQRGDDSAGAYEDAQAEHYTSRSGTAPSSGTVEGAATMMVNGSDGGGHGSDSEDDIKRLATAYLALDSVLGLNQQQRRQFEEQSNEFDIILRRFEVRDARGAASAWGVDTRSACPSDCS